MQPTFAAICCYFAPLILTSFHLGFGSTVLLTSHIESAATSLHFQRTLLQNYDKEVDVVDEELSVPTDEDVKSFYESLTLKSIEYNKYQVNEALQFFFKALGTADKSIIEIASESFAGDVNDPNAILKQSAFMDNGKKSDNYGLLKMMRNVAYESATKSLNYRYVLKKDQLESLSEQKLKSIYDQFKSKEMLSDTKDVEALFNFLKSASKSQLRKYKIDANSHIFYHRDEYASNVSDEQFNLSIPLVEKFLRFVIETITKETVLIENNKSELDKYIIEVVKDSKASISNYLNETPINYKKINEILTQIDGHFMSAAQSSKRIQNFVYGSETAPYPKFLVREIIVKNYPAYLAELSAAHADGIKGVYAADQEEIFLAAYQKDINDPNKSNWNWIKLLIRTGFEFSEDQKKALFRDIIKSNDTVLLQLMIDNRKLNLFDYQKDRGITFYHSILIDGDEELLEHVHSVYIIEEPHLKVKFIPNYTESSSDSSCSYWSPHENNFKLELRNFDLPGMKIRKGWDFLIIAAAAGRVKIVRALMDKSIDTSGYERIKEHLKDQSVISSIVSRR